MASHDKLFDEEPPMRSENEVLRCFMIEYVPFSMLVPKKRRMVCDPERLSLEHFASCTLPLEPQVV